MDDGELLLDAIRGNQNAHVPMMMYADLMRERGNVELADAYSRVIHTGSPFESLIGRTVTGAKTDGGAILVIDTVDGPISYVAEGDCCSNSWFYRVLDLNNLIGQKVAAVVEGRDDVDADDGMTQQDSDSVYSYCILSATGGCEVTFRNSSNGYYGGWLNVSQDDRLNGEGEVIQSSWQVPRPMSCMRPGYGVDNCKCAGCLIPGAK